jgi:hypothetical protein
MNSPSNNPELPSLQVFVKLNNVNVRGAKHITFTELSNSANSNGEHIFRYVYYDFAHQYHINLCAILVEILMQWDGQGM